jgi:hemerythrin-like domain-containing protein
MIPADSVLRPLDQPRDRPVDVRSDTGYHGAMPRRRRHPSLIPLWQQHRDALMLAFRLRHPAPPAPVTPMTPASTPQSRAAETLAFYDRHLHGHFRAEEDELFPFLRRRLSADAARAALFEELVAEHRRLAALRDAIAGADGEPALGAALETFAELLETHVRREERELFENFPDAVGAEEAETLAAAIRSLVRPQEA